MDKKLAELLMKKLHALGDPCNDAVELIEQISDVDEKKRFRRGIGNLMARAYTAGSSLIYLGKWSGGENWHPISVGA